MRVSAKARRVAILGAAAGILSCAGILDIEDRTKDPGLGSDGGLLAQDGSVGDDHTVPPGDDGSASNGDAGNPPPGSDGAAPGDGGMPGPGSDAGPHCAHPPCVLASGLNHPFLLTTDANNVYWTEYGTDDGTSDGAVKGCSLSGCATPTTYGIGLINPRGIAVDAANVYFTTGTYGTSGGIFRCAIGGCGNAPTQLSPAGSPYGLVVDDTYVYWTDDNDDSVHRIPKSGGSSQVLYDGGASDGPNEIGVLALDGTTLFFNDTSTDAYSLDKNGGKILYLGATPSTIFARDLSFGITTDTDSVYFSGLDEIWKGPKGVRDGGKVLTNGIPEPRSLFRDPSTGYIYWANRGTGSANDGTLGKIGPDGGGRATVAANLVTPVALAIVGSEIVWASQGTLDDAGVALPNTGAVTITPK